MSDPEVFPTCNSKESKQESKLKLPKTGTHVVRKTKSRSQGLSANHLTQGRMIERRKRPAFFYYFRGTISTRKKVQYRVTGVRTGGGAVRAFSSKTHHQLPLPSGLC